MFNPELRYLLVQEEHNGEMLPLIEREDFAALLVCGTNFLAVTIAIWIAYTVFGYAGITAKYVWTAFWNSLTPGQQWLEIAALIVIALSIVCAVVMFLVFQCVSDVLDESFTKLKNENNTKDNIIRELEAKISSLEATRRKVMVTQREEENELVKDSAKWFSI